MLKTDGEKFKEFQEKLKLINNHPELSVDQKEASIVQSALEIYGLGDEDPYYIIYALVTFLHLSYKSPEIFASYLTTFNQTPLNIIMEFEKFIKDIKIKQ